MTAVVSRFPILVDAWKGNQSLALGCNECGHRWYAADADEWIAFIDTPRDCPQCGRWTGVAPAYETGVRCPGCRRLFHEADLVGNRAPHSAATVPNEGCCSRRCALQVEYARELGQIQ